MTDLACPRCAADLEMLTDTPVGPIVHCASCDRNWPAHAVKIATTATAEPRREAALKLPGLDRGRQSVTVKALEEPIMQRIIKALRQAGYKVWSTVNRPKRRYDPRTGKWGYDGATGTDKGIPDLLVRNPAWPRRLEHWGIFLEVKGSHTRLSPEQQAEFEAGDIVVVRSVEEAFCAVRSAETEILGRE